MAETSSNGSVESDISKRILDQFRQLSKSKEEALIDQGKPVPKGKKRKTDSDVENDHNLRHQGLSEIDVGISEYMTQTEGFTGIIKHRFSDFQVNEIDPDGQLVELTSTDIPKEEKEEDATTDDYKSVLTEDDWKTLENIINNEEAASETLEIEVTEKDKTERSAIHKAVKHSYSSQVYSNTVQKDEKKYIVIGKANKNNKEREEWPKGRGRYLHCVLFKENMDMTKTVYMLSRFLRVKPNLITYAGNKDKRAKTSQRISISMKTAEQLAKFNLRQASFGNFSYQHKPLRLGLLSGNKFTIALRDVKTSNEVIEKAINALKETGFINYFGLQRFGISAVVPTFLIGKALLSSNWKEALELILKPKPGEKCNYDLKHAREVWWETRDAKKAYGVLSKSNRSLEGKILEVLKKQGDNAYYNAITSVPRNTLLIYLHSYQSLVWNKIVSRRIKEFGLKPIAGDLVFSNKNEIKEDLEESGLEEDEESQDNENEDNKTEVESKEEQRKRQSVKVLTEEEAEQTSIHAVVYPLPGFDVEYPSNQIADWYKEILKSDNLTEENLKNTHKTFSVSGAYRKITGHVNSLNWYTVHYDDVSADLIASDLDRLQNKSVNVNTNGVGEHKAVILEFKLKPSLYATMVLRELMKCETSCSHHANLTSTNHSTEDSTELKKPRQS